MRSVHFPSSKRTEDCVCYLVGGRKDNNEVEPWPLRLTFLASGEGKNFLHEELQTNIWRIVSTSKNALGAR